MFSEPGGHMETVQGNPLNDGFTFPARDDRGQGWKDDIQSHTKQSEFQDVRNGTFTVISPGQVMLHWVDACIGSETRPSTRALNKMANPVIIISLLSPFAGRWGQKMKWGIDAEEGITQACSLFYAILGSHTSGKRWPSLALVKWTNELKGHKKGGDSALSNNESWANLWWYTDLHSVPCSWVLMGRLKPCYG